LKRKEEKEKERNGLGVHYEEKSNEMNVHHFKEQWGESSPWKEM